MEKRKDSEYVELMSAQGEMEAEILRGVLESEEVRVRIVPHISQSVYPITVDGLGKMDIYVHADDLLKAKVVIAEYGDQE